MLVVKVNGENDKMEAEIEVIKARLKEQPKNIE